MVSHVASYFRTGTYNYIYIGVGPWVKTGTYILGDIEPRQHGYGDDNKAGHVPEPMFFYLGLVSGFIAGLWVVFCIILFKKTWRIAYFRIFDKVYDKIYVLAVVTWASLFQKMTAQ